MSGDSVGESAGDALTVSSTVGRCSCRGRSGFFAPRWSGAHEDNSPVPGASSSGSLVGGGGGSGRTSANVCALTLVVRSSFVPVCKWAPASTLLGAGGAGASSGF